VHVHLREGDLDAFFCKALGNPAIDSILDLFRNIVLPCPDVENEVEAGISEFYEKDRGCGILEKILGIFYGIMCNLKQYLLDPFGIGSIGNGDRDGNPQFLVWLGIVNDDIRGQLGVRDGDDLVSSVLIRVLRVPTDITSP
jgi:hypothetical protein